MALAWISSISSNRRPFIGPSSCENKNTLQRVRSVNMEVVGAMKCFVSSKLRFLWLTCVLRHCCDAQFNFLLATSQCTLRRGGIGGLFCRFCNDTLSSWDDFMLNQPITAEYHNQHGVNIGLDLSCLFGWGDDMCLVSEPYPYTQLSSPAIISDMKFVLPFAGSRRSVQMDDHTSFWSSVRKWAAV